MDNDVFMGMDFESSPGSPLELFLAETPVQSGLTLMSLPAEPETETRKTKTESPSKTITKEERALRRREQVARASKTAREKRKRMLTGLQSENEQLRKERRVLLGRIKELEDRVGQFFGQATASIQLENELLKAQLEEHKKFVGGFMQLASGVPSTESQRHRVYKKGADFALKYGQNLMVQAVRENWPKAKGTGNPQVAFRYKYVDEFGTVPTAQKQRLNVRIDIKWDYGNLDALVDAYWTMWSNSDVANQVWRNQRVAGDEIETLLTDTVTTANDEEGGENTAVLCARYHREHRSPPKKDTDWVFVAMKEKATLPSSSLTFTDETADKVKVPSIGCYMFGRSTTEHLHVPRTEKTQRITSLLVEGSVMWTEGDEVHQTVTLSFPGDVSFRHVDGPGDIITRDGDLTDKFKEFSYRYHSFIANQFKASSQ